MREKEIKFLWGRSGNRCAICKLELTPDGNKETLGEMAHIVAKSEDGPRGDSSLKETDRDKYNNLILLCPTHHTEIDKNYKDWPVEKLTVTKSKHETWVAEQLSTGNISVDKIDNTEFLQDRMSAWNELSRNHIAIIMSLTPLKISGDQIDTMDNSVQTALENAHYRLKNPAQKVNAHHTRPSEFGLVNENFPDLPKRFGHSFHIFRSGHCEYFRELGHDSDRITEMALSRKANINGAEHVIHYFRLAEVIDAGLAWLEQLWVNILPYEYMDFKCTIMNAKNTTLFSYEDDWGDSVFGYPTKSEALIYSDIIYKEHDASLLSLNVLKWVSNCYGLVLQHKFDRSGEYTRPVTLR